MSVNGSGPGIRADLCAVIAETTTVYRVRERLRRLGEVELPSPWDDRPIDLAGGPYRGLALPYPSDANDVLIGVATTSCGKWLAIYRVNAERTKANFCGILRASEFCGFVWQMTTAL